MLADPSMGVGAGQPDSLMQHSLAMAQNHNRKYLFLGKVSVTEVGSLLGWLFRVLAIFQMMIDCDHIFQMLILMNLILILQSSLEIIQFITERAIKANL